MHVMYVLPLFDGSVATLTKNALGFEDKFRF